MRDVTDILFGDEVTNMVKGGNLAAAFSLIYKWGYCMTLEGCTSTWGKDAMAKFIVDNGFRVILDGNFKGIKHMSSHGWHCIGKKWQRTASRQCRGGTRRDVGE